MVLPYRVGLTCGIGSGKTTVCELFSRLKVPVIDADVISRTVVEPGTEGLNKIIAEFGSSILNQDKTLNRSLLRQTIFDNPKLRDTLNSILHPLIYTNIEQQIKIIHDIYCIVSIPLLFETGGEKHVDRILLVDTSIDNQIARASRRDGADTIQIEKIIQSQLTRAERLKR